MDEADFTVIASKLLTDVRELVNWGFDSGNTTPEKLRFSIAARREIATKLIEGGMSQRDTARALGVHHSTIQADVAENPPKSGGKSATKAERRAARERALAGKIRALPDGRYGVIYADPPWKFAPWGANGMDRSAANHYPDQEAAEITALRVDQVAADDCVLFLWATVPMKQVGLAVMKGWGFDYRTEFIWKKDKIGTGFWNRNQHENLLVGVRGKPPAPAPGEQWPSVIEAPRTVHSKKPEIFHILIEEYFPNLPKLELYARGAPRPGWQVWGNEAEPENAAASAASPAAVPPHHSTAVAGT